MADAHNNAVRQLPAQQAVKRGFSRFIQSGSGLIEQYQFRLSQQNAGKSHALQFTRRQGLLPIAHFIELIDQLLQPARVSACANSG